MRGVITALILAAAIITGSTLHTRHISNISDKLLTLNEELSDAIENEYYEEAKERAENLNSFFHNKRTVLAATGNHEKLDEIEANLAEMRVYIDSSAQSDALSKCRTLGVLFDHLDKDFAVTLENIL